MDQLSLLSEIQARDEEEERNKFINDDSQNYFYKNLNTKGHK